MRAYRWGLLVVVAFGFASAGIASAVTPEDAIVQRQAGMKKNGDYLFPLGKKLSSVSDVAEFAPGARDVAAFAKEIPSLFPPGSETGHKTRAKAEIWSDTAQFKQDADNLSTQMDKLAQLAAANDKPGFVAQFKVAADACNTCHNKFRAPAP
ncbi:MAG TPA: cytochrome c [Acetobacteraceae bacterium]|jgi:cytochrome c556|nr:cytochrome c [Acetobacteraceae bacterium]